MPCLNVLLHRLRSLVCIVALVAVILPYLVGLGLARGIEAEAEASAHFGADLYLSGVQLGRHFVLRGFVVWADQAAGE